MVLLYCKMDQLRGLHITEMRGMLEIPDLR